MNLGETAATASPTLYHRQEEKPMNRDQSYNNSILNQLEMIFDDLSSDQQEELLEYADYLRDENDPLEDLDFSSVVLDFQEEGDPWAGVDLYIDPSALNKLDGRE